MDDAVLDRIFKPKIKKYFLDILNNNNRIHRVVQELKSISKENLGKSGAKVFYHDDQIVKMYPIKNIDYRTNKAGDCIHISNVVLEMINNFVFNNLVLFLTSRAYDTFIESGFNKHIIKVEDFGFYQSKWSNKYDSYIIQQKIGYDRCITLDEMIRYEKNIDSILPKLEKYFEVMKFLNKKLGFFHTDLTCRNVFLKKYRSSFICMVSDLDKSGLKLTLPSSKGKVSIFPNESSLSHRLGQSDYFGPFKNVYQFRYSCQRNKHFCDKFKPYHYDRITLLMDVYILALKQVGVTPKLEKFIMDQLDLNEREFEFFVKSIKSNYFLMRSSNANLGFHINYSMYKFCNMLKKV